MFRKLVLLIIGIAIISPGMQTNESSSIVKGYVPANLPFFYDKNEVGLIWTGPEEPIDNDPEIFLKVRDSDKELVYLLWALPRKSFKELDIYVSGGYFEKAIYQNKKVTLENFPKMLIGLAKANLTFGTFSFPNKTVSIPNDDISFEIISFQPFSWKLSYKGLELFRAYPYPNGVALKVPGETITTQGPIVIIDSYEWVTALDIDNRGLPRFIRVPNKNYPPSAIYKLGPQVVLNITDNALIYRESYIESVTYFLTEIVDP